jgi:hypothetical protein
MPSLNETKYAALLNATGATPPITLNELEILWLKSKGRTGTLNEMWYQQFAAAGFTGAWNSAACGWLGAFGYVGTLNERWYQFWTDGGSVNPNLVVNGGFDTDTDWFLGLGWTIADGKACCDGQQASDSDLFQGVTLEAGATYRLRYTILSYTAGLIRPVVGGTDGTNTAGTGTVVEDITTVATGSMVLKANVDFIGCIDNVSLRKV